MDGCCGSYIFLLPSLEYIYLLFSKCMDLIPFRFVFEGFTSLWWCVALVYFTVCFGYSLPFNWRLTYKTKVIILLDKLASYSLK